MNSLLLGLRIARRYRLWRRRINDVVADFILRRCGGGYGHPRHFHFRSLTVARVAAFSHVFFVGELLASAFSKVRTTGQDQTTDQDDGQ